MMLAILLQVATIPDSAGLMRAAFKHAYANRYSNGGVCLRLSEDSTGDSIRTVSSGIARFLADAGVSKSSPALPETRMDIAYQLIARGEEEHVAGSPGLEALSGLYPAEGKTCRQTWQVSRPAFAHGFGFVDIDMHCGPMCGKGGIFAFEYVRGRWKYAGMPYAWVS